MDTMTAIRKRNEIRYRAVNGFPRDSNDRALKIAGAIGLIAKREQSAIHASEYKSNEFNDIVFSLFHTHTPSETLKPTYQLSNLINSSGFFVFRSAFNRKACG